MTRPFIFMCRACHRSHRDEPGETMCLRCCSDAAAVRVLYTRAVREYPSLKGLTIPQFVERLYEAATKRRP